MNALHLLAITLIAGMLIAAQAAINGDLAQRLGSPTVAALVSLLVSTVLLLPGALFAHHGLKLGALASVPWWSWLGGIAGAVFVTAGLIIAPRVGIALFVTTAIAGQLLAAALIDQFGLFGMAMRPIDTSRFVGLGLVLAGVLVYRFGRF